MGPACPGERSGRDWPRRLARVAGAADTTYHDDDVRALLNDAGDLVVESIESGQPVYRLFHEALAEHLRAETDESEATTRSLRRCSRWLLVGPGARVERYVTACLPVHLKGMGEWTSWSSC